MSSPVEQLQEIAKAAADHLAATFNAPDLIPFGQAALALISAYPEERPAFVRAFLNAINTPDTWDMWFIQFCVHALRWPELKAGFEAMSQDAVASNDWNRIQPLGFAMWLLILLIALVSNNSFKPTPLRGAA